MLKVLLIDADSTIPNIPLMKISTFHKMNGDCIELVKLNIPYYPNRRKREYNVNFIKQFVPGGYDKVYCSVVFDGNKDCVKGEGIIYGGTGVDLTTTLSDEIENLPCDYSLYPENTTSYGFITRGCIRNCSFCKVPTKEGMIRKVANIDDIVVHKRVKFLDNNILSYDHHKSILTELVDKKIQCQFNQGLDIRLVDRENSMLLSKLNYIGEYIFAFDDIKYKQLISDQLTLLDWRKDWQFKFFVYVNPKMSLANIVKRIEWLKFNKCLPYIMRDITCWESTNSDFYVDIAAYCNQVHIFKKLDFKSFLTKRHTNKRIEKSLSSYNKGISI